MSDNSAVQTGVPAASSLPKLHQKNSRLTVLFCVLLILGIAFAGVNLFNDVSDTGAVYTSYIPFYYWGWRC